MIDRPLGIFLIMLFGISGIALLVLAWLRPMSESERILTISIGSVGLFVALVRMLLLRPLKTRAGAEQTAVEVDIEDKP